VAQSSGSYESARSCLAIALWQYLLGRLLVLAVHLYEVVVVVGDQQLHVRQC